MQTKSIYITNDKSVKVTLQIEDNEIINFNINYLMDVGLNKEDRLFVSRLLARNDRYIRSIRSTSDFSISINGELNDINDENLAIEVIKTLPIHQLLTEYADRVE